VASTVSSLKNEVLPSAQGTFDAVTEGYRIGKFDFLEMLDAQRTLFDVKGSYIDALAKYHRAVADVERLVGEPLR
jgi:cobalt-zinc-cadmium efflux system outer membrane protein